MNNEFISSIEEIIEDQKLGKMVIMVDDEDRENEGDLIIPAAKVDDQAINFMATHGRGLICLSLTEDRVQFIEILNIISIGTLLVLIGVPIVYLFLKLINKDPKIFAKVLNLMNLHFMITSEGTKPPPKSSSHVDPLD